MGSNCAVWTHPLCGCPSHSSWASHLTEVPPHLSQSLTPCVNSLPFRHPLIYHQGCQLSLSTIPAPQCACVPSPRWTPQSLLFPFTLAGVDVWSWLSHSLSKCLTSYLKPVLLRLLRWRQSLPPQPCSLLMLLQGRFLCYSNPLSPFENMSQSHFIRLSAVSFLPAYWCLQLWIAVW